MADGWESVRSLPGLEAGELQVWRVDLAEAGESPEIYKQSLSSEELERAGRFRAAQVKAQFVAARACLRIILSNLAGVAPPEVPITLSAFGKPGAVTAAGRPVFFNLAHSRETILIALCRESRVGIDLEYFDRETDVLEIARRTFTEGERSQIEAAGTPEEQRRAFFRCWTRKEAVVKADGRGLSMPLTSFEVPVLAEAEAAPIRIAKTSGEPGGGVVDWYVSDLTLGQAIAGAYAVEIATLRLRTLAFPLAEFYLAHPKG